MIDMDWLVCLFESTEKDHSINPAVKEELKFLANETLSSSILKPAAINSISADLLKILKEAQNED